MTYRGGDLDLRTAQTRGTGERASFEPPFSGTRDYEDSYSGSSDARAPIWVDDTLMACCNHAFDVAQAHRSGEVRIEHLLFALTRIDEAAEVLEKHGIRDASLRREAGSYIASELPIAPANGQATPRRSQALEQALQLAAQHAYSRNRAASVSDLLHVFSEVKPDLPGLELLHRHGRGGGEVPPAAAPYPAMRRPVRPVYYEDYPPAEMHGYRQGSMQNHTDMVQNQRLATLEQMIMALRDDTGRFSDDFAGRFASLEGSFLGARENNDGGAALKKTSDKLEHIERFLTSKLEDISDKAAQLAGRLEEMESRLSSAAATGSVDMAPLDARLDRIEAAVREDQLTSEASVSLISTRVASEFDNRLQRLESLIATVKNDSLDLVPIENRLNDIETAVLSSGDSSQMVATLTTRLEALESSLANRLMGIQQAQAADKVNILQQSSAVAEEVKTATREVAAYREALGQRFENLETMNLRHGQEAAEGRETSMREMSEVHEAIIKLNANQHTLAGAIDQWRGESVSDLNSIATRLAQLDADNDEPMQRLEFISERMDGMYRATVERYHRRNRFWYWLLGTDDWIGKSWPSQAAKVEQELQAMSASPSSSA
jgi:predicted  nucleic acid-binding Zn-ribbon protein